MLRNILKFKLNSGQSIIEYSVLLIIIMAGVITMGPYVVRSWHAHVKGYQDSVEDSRSDPLDQSNENPGMAPRCLCYDTTPNMCGAFGCDATTEATVVEVCTPLGCKEPRESTCVSNKRCCGPWRNLGCGDTVDYGKCQGNKGKMYQERTCGENVTESRCLSGHPLCNSICQSSPVESPPKDQKYGDVCPGDEDDLLNATPYTIIPTGGCRHPEINNLAKCQMECASPFSPAQNNLSCACSSGQEVLDETATPPKLTCKCVGLLEGCDLSPGVLGVNTTGCPAGRINICKDNWNCCQKLNSTKKKPTPEFIEVTPTFSLVGASCEEDYVVTKIFVKNESGSEIKWQFECRDIQKSCFTGITDMSPQFDSASTTLVSSSCPDGFVMTGIRTATMGAAQIWRIECSELTTTCLNSFIPTPSPQTFLSGPIGADFDEAPPCYIINGLETQRTSPGVNEWRINYIQ